MVGTILKDMGSSLAPNIGYPDLNFHDFPLFLHAYTGIVLYVLCNHFFPHPFQFIIHNDILFDATLPMQLRNHSYIVQDSINHKYFCTGGLRALISWKQCYCIVYKTVRRKLESKLWQWRSRVKDKVPTMMDTTETFIMHFVLVRH